MNAARGRCKLFLILGLGAALLWGCAQRLEKISSDGLMERCAKAVEGRPYRVSSSIVKGPQGQKARTRVTCWKEGDSRLALSELWVGGKKVYETPRAALAREHHCGSAAGELYYPHSFSPNGRHFAFLFIPFCWETEPLPPVVLLNRVADKATKAPDFNPIVRELSQSNPVIAANRSNIDFISNIAGWEGDEELLVDVDVICYGCLENGKPREFAATRWAVTPDDTVRFVGVGFVIGQ